MTFGATGPSSTSKTFSLSKTNADEMQSAGDDADLKSTETIISVMRAHKLRRQIKRR